MRAHSVLLLFVCLTTIAFDGAATAADPPLDMKEEQQIREALRWIRTDDENEVPKQYQYLIRMGQKAFPVYEAILSDLKADPDDVGGVLFILCELKADRRRFIEYVVSHLTDTKFGNRLNALALLKEIGSSAEASPVVAFLADERVEAVYAAARTLAAIGGRREVVALDVWLRGNSRRDDTKLRQHVKKCRDELKRRLDENRVKAPSEKGGPPQEPRKDSK